jgi:REP element-mobilizing transposase RayT
MLLSAEKNNPGDILRDFKRHTSKKISELLIELNNQRLLKYFATTAGFIGKGNDYKIWQQGSHPEPIFSEKFLLQKLNYVHQNPVRKGFVDKPEYWVFSSARNYSTGDQSILTIDFLP